MNKNILSFLILTLAIMVSGCSYFYPTVEPLQITTKDLPAWHSGEEGSARIEAIGGVIPYRCSLTSGSLPEGFKLDEEKCTISGKGILAGGTTKRIFPSFTTTIQDSSNPPQFQSMELTIIIIQPPPELTTNEGECIVNEFCSVNLIVDVKGGTPSYHYQLDSFANGAPPVGMILDLNGNLKGTPKVKGTYNFRVCAVDLVGATNCKPTTVVVEDKEEEMLDCPKGTHQEGNECVSNLDASCGSGHSIKACSDGSQKCCLDNWVCCVQNGQIGCNPQYFCD